MIYFWLSYDTTVEPHILFLYRKISDVFVLVLFNKFIILANMADKNHNEACSNSTIIENRNGKQEQRRHAKSGVFSWNQLKDKIKTRKINIFNCQRQY